MKPFVVMLTAMLCAYSVYGQHVEYSIHFNSGLFHYAGNDALRTTLLSTGSPSVNSATVYSNGLTGRLNGFSYGGSFSIQKITKHNLIYGIDAGWESLASRIQITGVWQWGDSASSGAKGNIHLRNDFINSYPFAGYRFKIKNVMIDAVAGLENAFMLSSEEKGNAVNTDTHAKYVITQSGYKPLFDLTIRWRAQLTAWYKKWGVNVGYSHDLTNYYPHFTGGQAEAYGRYFRLGFSYKIK